MGLSVLSTAYADPKGPPAWRFHPLYRLDMPLLRCLPRLTAQVFLGPPGSIALDRECGHQSKRIGVLSNGEALITRKVPTNGFGKLYFDILFSRTSIQYISIHRMIDSLNSYLRVWSHMADL